MFEKELRTVGDAFPVWGKVEMTPRFKDDSWSISPNLDWFIVLPPTNKIREWLAIAYAAKPRNVGVVCCVNQLLTLRARLRDMHDAGYVEYSTLSIVRPAMMQPSGFQWAAIRLLHRPELVGTSRYLWRDGVPTMISQL